MTRAMRAAALTVMLPLLVSSALLAGACAKAEEQAGTESDALSTGEAASAPAESSPAEAAVTTDPAVTTEPPTTTEPAATPPPTNPPPAQAPELPSGEEPAPPGTTVAPEVRPEVVPQPIDPPGPSPASATSDEEPAAGDEATSSVPESLPGEPYEYGPDEGTSLAVVGVPYEDVLSVRDVPSGEIIVDLDASNPYEGLIIVRESSSGEVLASLDAWTGTIVATGRTQRLPDTAWPDAVWNEIHVAGLTGWARAAHLAPVGLTDDLTAHLIDALGERPTADTLIELALVVGEATASQEPPSRVHIVTRPIVFEALGEVTVDVLNLGDDSVLGYRLHLFAVPAGEDWMSEDPGPFTLRTVERTILCYSHRGVTTDGLCI